MLLNGTFGGEGYFLRIEESPTPEGGLSLHAEEKIVADRLFEKESLVLAILGDKSDANVSNLRCGPVADILVEEADGAGSFGTARAEGLVKLVLPRMKEGLQ